MYEYSDRRSFDIYDCVSDFNLFVGCGPILGTNMDDQSKSDGQSKLKGDSTWCADSLTGNTLHTSGIIFCTCVRDSANT